MSPTVILRCSDHATPLHGVGGRGHTGKKEDSRKIILEQLGDLLSNMSASAFVAGFCVCHAGGGGVKPFSFLCHGRNAEAVKQEQGPRQ